MPDPIAWEEIEPHLDRALELDAPAREVWLAQLDAAKPAVGKVVRAMLVEREQLNEAGFLQSSPVTAAEGLVPALREMLARQAIHEAGVPSVGPAGLAAGNVVGPYRLIREIGHGGMSSVWLAERLDGQLKREVALKLPLPGLRMHVERFVRERDILAALTHPNIARLYDAGVSDSGQPYLAMEYVAGTALVRSCNEQCLSIRARLQLFLAVLGAVEFAHAELIIHRDLKPSNLLVTPQNRVVLLDFGIAKLLTDGTVGDESPLTQLFGRALTPDYASPEQISNQPLGTASDIYSLGVILYELLTGARPYRPKRDSRAALEESILTGELKRPSQSEIPEAASDRAMSPRALARALRGDLDTIVLKALRKDPLERYASVTAFAQDIGNHLQRLPVSARPDSNWYRVGRFVSRHKIPVAAATVATLALLGGSILALWQAREAAAERDRAIALASRNEAVSDFLGRVITESAESSQPVTVSEMLARSEKLALADTSGSPENRAAILSMIAERYTMIDNPDRALPLLQSALALVANSPDHALRTRIACRYAATNADFGHEDVAIRAIVREVATAEANDPDAASYCLLDLSRIYGTMHHGEDAVRSAEKGLALIHGRERNASGREAPLLSALAFGYHLTGRNVEAERLFDRSMRKYSEVGLERSDGALLTMNDRAVVILGAGKPREALSLIQRAEQMEVEREPGALPSTTLVGARALALMSLGRFEESRIAFNLECSLAVRNKDEYSQIHCLIGRTSLLLFMNDPGRAAVDLDEATRLLGDAPPDSPPMLVRAVLQGRLALARGHAEEAHEHFSQVLARKGSGPTTFYATLFEAEAYLAGSNPAEAERVARLALAHARVMQGDFPSSNYNGLASLTLGRSLLAHGDRAQAESALKTAVQQLSQTVDADHPALLQARELLDQS